jgi:hypothetical protein
MQTLTTLSFIVLAIAGTGFVVAYTIVIGHIVQRPLRALASLLF